jgi:hypothetical protein
MGVGLCLNFSLQFRLIPFLKIQIFENSKKKKDRNEISKTRLRVNKRVVKIFQKEKKKKENLKKVQKFLQPAC